MWKCESVRDIRTAAAASLKFSYVPEDVMYLNT